MCIDHPGRVRRLFTLCGLVIALVGCAAAPVGRDAARPKAVADSSPPPIARPGRPARFRASDDFEFTVTESVRIPPSLRSEYDAALQLLQGGRLQDGIRALEVVVGAGPQFVAPHLDLGVAYLKRKDYEKAEASLKTALTLAPDHPVAANELGVVYRRTGRFELARESFETALARFPNYHYSQRNLGVLCDLFLDDLECALENYEAYQHAFPNEKLVEIWIADVRSRIEAGVE